jgi:hypothetical protein
MATEAHFQGVTVTKIEKSASGTLYSGDINISLTLGSAGITYQVHFDKKDNIAKAVDDAIREIQSALADLSQRLADLAVQI